MNFSISRSVAVFVSEHFPSLRFFTRQRMNFRRQYFTTYIHVFITGYTIMCQGATSLIKLRSHTKPLTICVNINCASNLRVGYRNPVIVEALEGPTLWKYIRSIGYRSRDYSLYFSCLQYRTEPHRSL